jgi:hypothetical protein
MLKMSIESLFNNINGTETIVLDNINEEQKTEFTERLKLFLYLRAIVKLANIGKESDVFSMLSEKLNKESLEYLLDEYQNVKNTLKEVRENEHSDISNVDVINYIFAKRYCSNSGAKMQDCVDLINCYHKAELFLDELFRREIE